MHPLRYQHLFGLITLTILAIASIVFNQTYQQQIFPSITTAVSLNKETAIEKALQLNHKNPLGMPETKLQAAASYLTNQDVNSYLSLTDQSNHLLNTSLEKKQIQTSFWSVRLYITKAIQENYYFFTPDGQPYGFSFQIPEDMALPNLDKAQAISLAQKKLHSFIISGIDANDYILKDHNQEKKPGHTTHTLLFENHKLQLAEAKLQLQVIINGNQVTTYQPLVKLPENFSRHYANMRSYNQTLGLIGGLIILLGYGGITLLTLFKGHQQGNLNWRDCLPIALIITGITSLNAVNVLPLSWYALYPTTQTTSLFLSEQIIQICTSAGISFLKLITLFCAADYLDRKAFPNHVHAASWWHTGSAASRQTGFLIGLGYIMFGLNIGYQSLFYLATQAFPSVWIPTGLLVNPNFISTYLPFLYPLSVYKPDFSKSTYFAPSP